MWLIPYVPNQNHFLYINLPQPTVISGIKLWNYNKTADDTYRGVKTITVMGDGSLLTPKSGVLVKKAPGNVLYDFGQFIPLPFMNGWEKSKVD